MSPKNKLRVCLILVLFMAIAFGVFYYYYSMSEVGDMGSGTLVFLGRVRESLYG